AAFKRLRHVFAMIASRVGVATPLVEGKFGGDDKLVALAANEFAHELFTRAVRVAVGGVEEIAAGIDVGVEDRLGFVPVRAPAPFLAKGHGAQAKFGNAQTGFAE